MPICEADPWRVQYFASARCPPDVRIPTEDSDAWTWNPRHRWVYDRIAIAQSQGIDAGPHGTLPPSFPVFSKPIVNLKGMGLGTRILQTPEDYDRHCTAGHMWMQLLSGRHLSSDAAVVSGEVRWWRHVTGLPAGGGTFDYWTVHADAKPALEASLGRWIANHLGDYTGLVNLETVGGSIIEIHLRPSDQWPDLYGHGWVDALVHLYSRGEWRFADRDRRNGYSVVLFDRHDVVLAASFAEATRRYSGPSHRFERPDHVPRGSRSAAARDASGWLPAGDRELLEPRGRPGRSQSAPHVLSERATNPQHRCGRSPGRARPPPDRLRRSSSTCVRTLGCAETRPRPRRTADPGRSAGRGHPAVTLSNDVTGGACRNFAPRRRNPQSQRQDCRARRLPPQTCPSGNRNRRCLSFRRDSAGTQRHRLRAVARRASRRGGRWATADGCRSRYGARAHRLDHWSGLEGRARSPPFRAPRARDRRRTRLPRATAAG